MIWTKNLVLIDNSLWSSNKPRINIAAEARNMPVISFEIILKKNKPPKLPRIKTRAMLIPPTEGIPLITKKLDLDAIFRNKKMAKIPAKRPLKNIKIQLINMLRLG